MNKISLCTIFNSNYLDKALALYYSLMNCCKEFNLYFVTYDAIAERVLLNENLDNVIIIPIRDIETEEYLSVKQYRSIGEYCWTCTPRIIEYVLENYDESIVTYIDVDLFFYNSPVCLIEELIESGCSVGIMGHRFANRWMGKNEENRVGRFCIEFNTFSNSLDSLKLLSIWKNQCLLNCSYDTCGDQIYTTDWVRLYDFVYEYKNYGAGVAPWNMGDYKFVEENGEIEIEYKGVKDDLIFFHFQGMQYDGNSVVRMHAFTYMLGMTSRNSVSEIRGIYIPYITKLERYRAYLWEKYSLDMFYDGCKGKRDYTIVKFKLGPFLKGIQRRIKNESVFSAINFIICVCRKRYDFVDLSKIREEIKKEMN